MNGGCKLARIYFDIATQPAPQFCVVVSPDTTTQWLYQGRIKYIAIHQKRQMDQSQVDCFLFELRRSTTLPPYQYVITLAINYRNM